MKGATTIMMGIHFQPPLPAYTFIMEFDHGWNLWFQQAHNLVSRKMLPLNSLYLQGYRFESFLLFGD